jgi:hypothetical protein
MKRKALQQLFEQSRRQVAIEAAQQFEGQELDRICIGIAFRLPLEFLERPAELFMQAGKIRGRYRREPRGRSQQRAPASRQQRRQAVGRRRCIRRRDMDGGRATLGQIPFLRFLDASPIEQPAGS